MATSTRRFESPEALATRRDALQLPFLPAGVDAEHAAGLMTRAARGDDAALAALERTAAWSRNTLRTYLRAWTAWTRWAAAEGVPAMPASSADVRAFVLNRVVHAGRSIATARADVAGISAIHQAAGQPSPRTGRRRGERHDHAARQGTGAAPAAGAGARRGRARRDPRDGTHRAARPGGRHPQGVDRVAGSGRASGGARHRAVQPPRGRWPARVRGRGPQVGRHRARPRWQRPRDGAALESDQEAVGAVVAITPTAMQDLAELRRGQPPAAAEALVFGGLSGDRLARRIKAVAQAAGLGAHFSGHSGRVGMARRMVSRGAPLPVVVRQGRWRPATGAAMVQRYTRAEDASAALPYLGEGA